MARPSVCVEVKSLALAVQSALKIIGYGARDITVVATETESPSVSGGQGSKGFCTLVNLDTGHCETHYGSWGGANMFNPQNQVDLNTKEYHIPPNGCVIKGSIGHPRTFATVFVNPSLFQKFLPSGEKVELSDIEKKVLKIWLSCKSSYRMEEARREGLSHEETVSAVRSLLAKKLFQQNSAGSISVTLKGKNYRD